MPIPATGKVFEATTDHLRVRIVRMGLDDLWATLCEVAEGTPDRLSAAFGDAITLPVGANPAVLQDTTGTRALGGRQNLILLRNVSVNFHELFGYQLIDRLGPQLKAHRPPYGGTKEIAENLLPVWGSRFQDNNANPMFEVAAELPVGPLDAFFNSAQGGIEIRTTAGLSVPLEDLSVSVTPEPRCRVLGTEFERVRQGDSVELVHLVKTPEPTSEITVDLQFRDVAISSSTIRPKANDLPVFIGSLSEARAAPWVEILKREFHWTLPTLRRRLRASLPRRAAEVAESRIAASIQMREGFPFFALVSAASVAELLLKERIRKVGKKKRGDAWAIVRAESSHPLQRRLPEDLKFDHAIRLGSCLGILGDIDSTSLDLLRLARNELHLDRTSRASHEDFSPVRASAAIWATLNLSQVVERRAKRARQPKTPPALPP